jgi:hypothetical protein
MPTDNPRSNKRRITAIFYARNPESGAPEMELIRLAAAAAGHRTPDEYLRWAGLVCAQRVLKHAMRDAQQAATTDQQPEESNSDGDQTVPDQVDGGQGRGEEAGRATQAD